ncbi:hypothetical protein AVEN_274195-1 [Araneus ventricosus]|uniref:Uncharacterized protein n=1 Tax=Araneus ventricosus TaxID=182803 RepID=A0A4Y2JVU4_ARAVE|nr:hypothetical protein AVEN_274195-1 [Araneus ventricosus]
MAFVNNTLGSLLGFVVRQHELFLPETGKRWRQITSGVGGRTLNGSQSGRKRGRNVHSLRLEKRGRKRRGKAEIQCRNGELKLSNNIHPNHPVEGQVT